MTEQWWQPQEHATRRPRLLQVRQIKSALRSWFEEREFLEVECGALQVSPGNETHLHAFSTTYVDDGGRQALFYLQTSPEFSCKKLIAAGETKLFDFARAFRNREAGPLHSPEFTMLEWYRVGANLREIMEDCVELCRIAVDCVESRQLVWKNQVCNPSLDPEYLTLQNAFQIYAGIDLESVLSDSEAFRQAAATAGIGVPEGANWSDIFSAVLVTKIEHRLGQGRLTLLHRYPICEAALARPCEDDPRFADRFEMYACGVELANGFNELTDPVEQRARFKADMALKQSLYGERYPLDEDLLAALPLMPQTSGVALGFDRLAMLATGAKHISDVQWTPLSL